ncbi:MAG: 23S rRNA (pseudouridine(1915)-N(3))-methyltransferase RlmH [Pseudomonadota bacterium]
MRLTIAAVGRMRGGPEAAMVSDYAARTTAAGKGLGLGPLTVIEIDERKARDREQQSERLISSGGSGAVRLALDERGAALSSPNFAKLLAGYRDAGRGEALFLIGGADGHTDDLRRSADRLIGFGPMVWPHMLVRAMLAEQIYRAVSILGGSPYHRE